ncbi:conserved hypothetical protein [Desulforapulum autotrophicum HRM2]|uniref:Uncharacterized protein n=1 Tax=Desulforapulum autotrophicum (strain ATCC 43914 / DSM 3382 / VKM B-1955 / HRM2) TaxID=177437 RepID=C0QK16_DESAH|nr:conserved hypothetical protein [Desulforapulum autotrophicum HRM2]
MGVTAVLPKGRSLAGDPTGEQRSHRVKQLALIMAFGNAFIFLAGEAGAFFEISQFKVKHIPFFGISIHYISSFKGVNSTYALILWQHSSPGSILSIKQCPLQGILTVPCLDNTLKWVHPQAFVPLRFFVVTY